MDEVTNEDIERLASRMAMLVSGDGEADNAGRAVGQLARRLGLSGGDLKQIVLAGANGGFRPGSIPGHARLEQEIATLKRDLVNAEDAVRVARQDRDALMAENGAMRVAMYRRRAAAKLRRMLLALAVLGVALVGVGVVWLGPDIAGTTRPMLASPIDTARGAIPGAVVKTAIVRSSGARIYQQPDRSTAPLRTLPHNTRLIVMRTDWYEMMLWAQVEVDGRLGYVMTTEVEIY